MPASPNERLVSVKDTAALLGCSVATVWRNAGKSIPAPIKIGGMTRWSEAEILGLIDQAKADRQAT